RSKRDWSSDVCSSDLRGGKGLHDAGILSEGTDVTLVAYGPLVPTAQDVVAAAAEEGKSIELIDLRSLNPIDFTTIERSVAKTGRLVVAHEAPTFLGLGSEIAARITERCFFTL